MSDPQPDPAELPRQTGSDTTTACPQCGADLAVTETRPDGSLALQPCQHPAAPETAAAALPRERGTDVLGAPAIGGTA